MNTSLSIFARALATENISFSFDANAQTAGFDVKNRHLVMPVWNVSETVQTMLVAHEISHALWTPYEQSDVLFKQAEQDGYVIDLLQRICNVIEDVRIEKNMKEKFPGTRRDFFLGYKEINDLDLFKFKSMDMGKAGFISRLNIHYKWGVYGFLPVAFDAVEQEIVDAVDRVETFDECFQLAKMIYDHPLMKQTVQQVEAASTQRKKAGNRGNKFDPSQEKSDREEMLDNLVPDSSTLAKKSGEKFIHSSIILTGADNYNNGIISTSDLLKQYENMGMPSPDLNKYREFVRHSDAYVRQLAMQFERRKAADEIRKDRPKQTGQLNLDRLHQYRTHDDIFLSKIVKQEGKNHGIVFLLDMSGSMGTVIGHAYQQILQLVWFCEKVKIPFEVFGFTDVSPDSMPGFMEEYEAYRRKSRNPDFYDFHKHYSRRLVEKRNVATGMVYGQARLINLASSRDDAAKRERLLAFMYESMVGAGRGLAPALRLHGTPTVESVALASQFMVDWVKNNNIQIPTIMVVTDGEPNGIHTADDGKAKCWYNLGDNNDLTVSNEILGTVHFLKGSEYSGISLPNAIIGTMLDSLRQKLNARCIGMYVGGRTFNEGMYERYCLSRKEIIDLYERSASRPTLSDSPRYEAASDAYRDEGCIILHPEVFPGYDAYFLTKTPQIVRDEEAIADDGATFTKVKNTFIKTMARRGVSRVFLSRYVDIVAGQPLNRAADAIYNKHPWPSNWCPDRK